MEILGKTSLKFKENVYVAITRINLIDKTLRRFC